MNSCWRLFFSALSISAFLPAQTLYTVSGVVRDAATNLPMPNLAVRLIPPGGSTTPEVDALTDTEGAFSFRPMPTGRYLFEIDFGLTPVYREVISVTSDTRKQVSLVTTTTIVEAEHWRPADLASYGSYIFVLEHNDRDKDHTDRVSEIRTDSTGSRLDPIVPLPGGYSFSSVAASRDAIFVTGTNVLGCTVFTYEIGTRSLARKLFAKQGSCDGIATDGTTLYVVFSDRKEIEYWDIANPNAIKMWDLYGVETPGPACLDAANHELLLADISKGTLYSVSTETGKPVMISTQIGYANQLAVDQKHVLIASGKRILFVSRANKRGENPPPALEALTGGIITGIAVNQADLAWFADYDKHLIRGPFPLN